MISAQASPLKIWTEFETVVSALEFAGCASEYAPMRATCASTHKKGKEL